MTAPTERLVTASPLRRALLFVKRLFRPRPARGQGEHGRKESVAGLVPVLRETSPIALEASEFFGVDAAAWMLTAKFARKAYQLAETEAKKRLAAEAEKRLARRRRRAIR